MRVLGVDPGYDRVGLAVLEYQNQAEILHYSTCIETERTHTLPDRIKQVGEAVHQCITEYAADTLAIETLFFNKNVKTATSVAEARGVIIYVAKTLDCQVYEFSPQAIKIATTGHGASDKAAVIKMVKQLVPAVPETALDDEYDAIAVGITCLAEHGRQPQ